MAYLRTCRHCGKDFSTHVVDRQFCCVSCASIYRGKEKFSRELSHHLGCIRICKSKRDLKRRFPQTYRFGSYHKLPEFAELPIGESSQKVYSFDEVKEAAKKYKTKAEFHKHDAALYFCALRRGWMSQFTWLRSGCHLYDEINYIYRYFFPVQNAIYVGRTIKPEMRDYEHRRDRGKDSSVVFKFAKDHEIEIPQMELLETGLSGEASQIKENEYVSLYKEEGFLVLNKGATGIGTSSMGGKRKHTRKKLIEEARNYEWLSDFKREHHDLYVSASKYGWLADISFLKRKQRSSLLLTKEYCFEVSRQYKTRNVQKFLKNF